MNNVIQRTITGSIYTSLIIGSIIIHPLFFAFVTVLINIFAFLEFKKIGDKLSLSKGFLWIVLNNIFFVFTIVLIYLEIPYSYFLPLLLLLIILLVLPIYQQIDNPFSSMQFSLFGSLYITLPLVIINLIQQYSASKGVPITLALFIVIWTNDTFAYLSGMAFGKHRLFEKLSPKKSWEGFFGGLVMGIVAALIFNYFFPEMGMLFWVLFAVITCISAVFGDFVESLIKRTANIKDSGSILPGHGGILDRIDSLLLTVPVIYIYLFLFNSI